MKSDNFFAELKRRRVFKVTIDFAELVGLIK
jgi:hypothetical protein